MPLSTVWRLMPITSITALYSTSVARYQLQSRLAHFCRPSFDSLSNSHSYRTMTSTAATTSTSTTTPSTATTTPPTTLVTFTPRHIALPAIQPHHRVLFVGDVHGCFDELQALIAAAGVVAGTDYILLTGDLINKGPKPLDVIQWLLTTPNTHTVLGNHDHHVIRALQRQADGQTPADLTYHSHPHDYVAAHMSAAQRAYYLSLPLTIRLPSLTPPHLLVHAGLVPGVAVEEQVPFDLMNIRNVLEDGSGTKKRTEGVNWVERYGGEEGTVVFGHCAARGVQLVADGSGGMKCVGLDTGCCYGKELSGWLLPEKRLVQVKALKMYANPDE